MRLSACLSRLKVNLNSEHWHRRVWEKGYVGPPLPKIQRTGVPHLPVSESTIAVNRQLLLREWNVMQWLANPYLNADREQPYLERHGDVVDQSTQQEIEAKQRKMPSKQKLFKATGQLEKKRANVGNMLHSHRTVESQMQRLIRRSRWD